MFWEHLLLNRFAVGSLSSFQPLNYHRAIASFFPLTGIKKTFCYQDVEKRFREEKLQLLPAQLSPGWKSYYPTLFQEMRGTVAALGFYALPTLEPQRRRYQEAFAAALSQRNIMLAPPSREFMNGLLHQEYWFDGVHPQGVGGDINNPLAC